MATKVKGISIEIGGNTKGLTKALQEVNAKTNSVNKELREVEKLLKLDPKNAELLAQKQQLLAKQVDTTRNKLEALKKAKEQADRDMADGTEINAEQYRRLQREIISAEQALETMEKQAKRVASNAQTALKNAGNTAGEIGEKLTGAGQKMMPLTAGITAVGAAAVAAAEGTREYREDLGKLDTAFQTSGFSAEAARKAYEEFYVILGEEDRSIEAVNHLAELCSTEEELAAWGEICAGVTAKFGDSLPVEGLTEAANETAKVGKVTGTLADALNWAGKNEDVFNEELERCSSEQERSALITATLTGLYQEAAEQYKQTNAEIIENRRATSELTDAQAQLGAIADPIITDLKARVAELLSTLLDGYTGLTDGQQKAVLGIGLTAAAIGPVLMLLGQMASGVKAVTSALSLLATHPVGLAIGATAAVLGAAAIGAMKTAAAYRELSDEEQALCDSIEQRKSSYDSLRQSQQESLAASQAETVRTQELWAELQALADENGRVDDANRTRAQYILGELNSALGTEYAMNGDLISQYQTMQDEIDELVEKRQAAAMMDYIEPLAAEARASLKGAQEDYAAAVEAYEQQKRIVGYLEQEQRLGDFTSIIKFNAAKDQLIELEGALYTSAEQIDEYNTTLAQYEQASYEYFNGSMEKVVDILSGELPVAVDSATDKVKELSREIEGIPEKKTIEIGVNGVTAADLLNASLDAPGAGFKLYGNARGTRHARAGLSVVNEEGLELIEGADGSFRMMGTSPAITYLDEGDTVYTADETKRMAGGIRLPGFAGGKTAFASAKSELSHQKKVSSISVADELAWWQNALAVYAADADAVLEITEQIHTLTQKVNKEQADAYKEAVSDMMAEDERWNRRTKERGELSEKDYLWNLGNRADTYRAYADEVMQLDYMTEEERLELRRQYIRAAEDLDDQYLQHYQSLPQKIIASIKETADQAREMIDAAVSGLDLELKLWNLTEGKTATDLQKAEQEIKMLEAKIAELEHQEAADRKAYEDTEAAYLAGDVDATALQSAKNTWMQSRIDVYDARDELAGMRQNRDEVLIPQDRQNRIDTLVTANRLYNDNSAALRAMGYTDAQVRDWANQTAAGQTNYEYHITNVFEGDHPSAAEVKRDQDTSMRTASLAFGV